MKNRLCFRLLALCACLVQATMRGLSRIYGWLARAHYRLTRRTAHLNLAIINARRS